MKNICLKGIKYSGQPRIKNDTNISIKFHMKNVLFLNLIVFTCRHNGNVFCINEIAI